MSRSGTITRFFTFGLCFQKYFTHLESKTGNNQDRNHCTHRYGVEHHEKTQVACPIVRVGDCIRASGDADPGWQRTICTRGTLGNDSDSRNDALARLVIRLNTIEQPWESNSGQGNLIAVCLKGDALTGALLSDAIFRSDLLSWSGFFETM